MDGLTPLDCGTGSLIADDPLAALSPLMSFDAYSELCSPSTADQMFSPLGYSAAHQLLGAWSSLTSPNSMMQSGENGSGVINGTGSVASKRTDLQFSSPAGAPSVEGTSQNAHDDVCGDTPDRGYGFVPKSLAGFLLPEKMLRALSLLKGSSTGGILAQVWMPIKQGDNYMLSTCDQPFLLDKVLSGYREVSRQFVFPAHKESSLCPGLPGRVFMSGLPEWTPNVAYYSRFEYLRSEYAVRHEVRGSLAVPVFDTGENSCRAVLELVTTREKPDFGMEMDIVCNALQSVNLQTRKARSNPQCLTKNQESAFTEILDVLRAVCHAHMLPLALTWIPICRGDAQEVSSGSGDQCVLCVQESASYVNSTRMQGFLQACAERPLEKGQGIAGRALLSNRPFFSSDIRAYDIHDYPFAHHARKFGLCAAVVIRLRSTYTGDSDYILELFLPVNCRGSEEQQLLLNSLSSTMQRICSSLRTVSEAEVAVSHINEIKNHNREGNSSLSADFSADSSQRINENAQSTVIVPPETQKGTDEPEDSQKLKSSWMKRAEKKSSTVEKNISLSVLRQYFSGSLKDAAKSIGVCPTTLKRICRQHGITRWPSRKISKVNRSLKKIQNVINSVQGVEGSLQYDPATGCLVAAVSSPEKSPLITLQPAGAKVTPSATTLNFEGESSVPVLVPEHPHEVQKYERDEFDVPLNHFSHSFPSFDKHGSSSESAEHRAMLRCTVSTAPICVQKALIDDPSTSSMTDSSSGGSASSCPTSVGENGPGITVKATYKNDTVRFKILLSMGYHHLADEITRRFRLAAGAFQLKYKDDEDEWVILASDADLMECVEIMESMRSRSVKLQVLDVPCVGGSSASSSSCLLMEL